MPLSFHRIISSTSLWMDAAKGSSLLWPSTDANMLAARKGICLCSWACSFWTMASSPTSTFLLSSDCFNNNRATNTSCCRVCFDAPFHPVGYATVSDSFGPLVLVALRMYRHNKMVVNKNSPLSVHTDLAQFARKLDLKHRQHQFNPSFHFRHLMHKVTVRLCKT